jgi:hypothetical protein
VAGRQPGPGAQLRRASETMNVADLGPEDRRQHRAHPRDGLDRQAADVAGQGRADLAPKHRDLLVKGAQQLTERGDPQPLGARKPQLLQQPGAGHPEQVAHRHPHPCLASTAWTWALRPLRSATSLAR